MKSTPTAGHAKITFNIISGKDLIIRDTDAGSSDPFVEIEYGTNPKKQTKVIKKNLNPIWNDEINLDHVGDSVVKFVVLDQDREKNDPMGVAELDLATAGLVPSVTKKFTLPVVYKAKPAGAIEISARYFVEGTNPPVTGGGGTSAEDAEKIRLLTVQLAQAQEKAKTAEEDQRKAVAEQKKATDALAKAEHTIKVAEEEVKRLTSALQAAGSTGTSSIDDESIPVDPVDLPVKLNDNFNITCTKCKDTFFDPQVLPCYHTFCSKCVCYIGGTKAACRICYNATRKTAVRPNSILAEFIEKVGRTPKPQLCVCKEPATIYCFDCKTMLCKTHSGEHSAAIFTKNHKTGTPGEGSVIPPVVPSDCTKHNKKFDTLCEPCNKLVCTGCIPEHPGHKILTFAEAAAKLRPGLESRFTGVLLANTDKISLEIAALEKGLDEVLRFTPSDQLVKDFTSKILEKKVARHNVRLYINSTMRILRSMTDYEVVDSTKCDVWLDAIKEVTPDNLEGRVGVLRPNVKEIATLPGSHYAFQAAFIEGVVVIPTMYQNIIRFHDISGRHLFNLDANAGGFSSPQAACFDSRTGWVVVSDGASRALSYDKAGVMRRRVNFSGNHSGSIHNIITDPASDFMYIVSGNRLQKSDKDGKIVKTLEPPLRNSAFAGLAITQNGDILVSDGYTVKVCNSELQLKSEFGGKSAGKATGDFDGANGICIDGAGNILVADMNNRRIQVFSSTYQYKSFIPTTSGNPQFISIDNEGRLAVCMQSTSNAYLYG